MTNQRPRLRIIGEAQTGQAEARIAALTKQVEALNAAMAKTAAIPSGGSPAGFTKTTAALGAASRAYNESLAASNAFRVENLKVNDVLAQQTDLLRRQKLGYKDIWGSQAARRRMQLIRREQQAMKNMTVRAVDGGIGDGHLRANLAIPADVPKSWDTLRDRVGMFRMELQSASRVLLNWGKNTQWAGRQLMAGITYPVIAFGAAAGVMAYQVDKEFTRIQKVYNTTADANSKSVAQQVAAEKELAQVREAGGQTALRAAKEYGAAMTDTLAVQADLAATGQKGAMLQGATSEVMKNAMLGEIDVQTTTKATIALQQQLHLSTRELGDQWAYLNAMENQTSLTMQDFAQAIPIALGPLKQMGGTVQDLGTLLTAMVSRGIQVGKAANAIKATAQRLLRPSKQVAEEFRAITGADIKQIAANNEGNMMGIMKDLYEVTKDLTEYDKSKAFAGLFGSYQLATMSAMVDGMGDLSNGMTEVESQVVMAQKVGTQSAAEWRRIQDLELKRMQESVSGRFKRTLETVKASLALAGEPFLDIASDALSMVDKILGAFNSLSKSQKYILAWSAAIVGVLGPLIMLGGLFANLIANAGLFSAGALKLVSRFNLLNKAEWAQLKLDEKMEAQMYSSTNVMKSQTVQLEALTRAMIAHNQAMAMSPGYAGTPAGKILQDSIPPIVGDPMTHRRNTANLAGQLYWNEKAQRYGESGIGADGKKTYTFMKKETAELKAQKIYADEIARSQGMTTRQAFMEKRARERTQETLRGSNLMMGAMAASTVLMVQNTHETGQNIGQWMMMLAIGIPALQGLGSGVGSLATRWALARDAAEKTRMNTIAMAGPTGKVAGLGARLGAGLKGAGAALVGMTGPAGLVAAAVAAAGFGIYKLYQHEKKITEEKRNQANAMYEQKNLLEEQLKITRRQRETFSVTAMDPASKKAGLPDPGDLADDMAKSDDFKEIIKLLGDEGALDTEKSAAALMMYRDVLESTGGSAKKATIYLEALGRASGMGAFAAARWADDVRNSIGTAFDASESLDLFKDQIASIYNDTDDLDSIREQGKHLAFEFQDAVLSGGRENADKTFGEFAGVIESRMNSALEDIAGNAPEVFDSLGLESKAAATDFLKTWTAASNDTRISMLENLTGLENGTMEFGRMHANLNRVVYSSKDWQATLAVEEGLVKQIGADLEISEKMMENITTLAQIRATWEFKVATATEKNAVALFKQREAQSNALLAITGKILNGETELNDEQRLRLANQLREATGGRRLTNIYELNAWLAGELTDETEATAKGVKKIGDAWAGVSFGSEMKNILQQGMEGVTSDLADAASETFENRMDSAIEGAQSAWDRRIEALNERHERVMDAFDERWERRRERVEAAYDAQIKGIDKAIEREEKAEELRQKMFEAEMTRIERLKDVANANIDFNVALRTGDLDEAARIQNDMAAQAQEWALGDAQSASADRSKAKVDALGASKDEIEEAKDKRLEAMAEIEEKQREHLEKMQEQEADSLQERSENAMENMRDQWDAERKNLNDKLDLFRLYTARNKKDLDRWLAEVGLSYDDFGASTMMKGEDWAGSIQKSLKKHVRDAGTEIANSQLWEQWGNEEAKKTLAGMGFGGLGQFKKFIRTGELPADFGRKKPETAAGSATTTAGGGPGGMGGYDMHHEGGIVGKSRSSRKGVARTAGMHRSEQMVLAQKGEGILTRDAVSHYGSDIVDRMNSGKFEGGLNGPAGIMAAMAMRGLVAGVSKSYANAVEKKKAQLATQSALGALFGSGALGNYELGGVKPWVQEAANYLGGKFSVSNILGVGTRASNSTSDHPKGLAIDLMTGTNTSLGDAIAAEALRIQDVLDATYMIWNGRIHSFDSRGWRDYRHPSGATDDTSMHRDHVHISFEPTGVTGDLPTLTGVGTGPGGKHKAADPGKGWLNTHDYQNGLNSRLYAFNDAKVIESRAVTQGGSPGNGLYGGKYRSYGETIVLQDSAGNKVRYAHLAPGQRFVNVGDVVPGGTIIGLSGMTGNASGPHTHFEWNGSNNAEGGMAGYGIPLRTGGFIKKDNVPATLHKDEQVVDKKRTRKLYNMVDNFDHVASPWFNPMGARLNNKGMPVYGEQGAPGRDKEDTKGSGKAGTVRSGTYNLYRKTSNEASMRDLTRLFGMADILSLTELIQHKRGLIPWIQRQGWGVHTGTGSNDAGLVWNRSKMSMLKGGFHRLPGAGGSGAFRDRMAAWGQFRTNTGTMFNQISAHTMGQAQGGGAGMRSQYAALGGLVKELTRTGLPLILGGDLNTRMDQGMPNFGLKGMGRTGLQHVLGTVAGKSRVVGGMSSDHPAILSTFDIPALAKGAQNIRWDNTLANLHKGEAVLTEDLNRQFKQGVANFANGGQTLYNINVVLNEADMSPEELAYKIQRIQQRAESRVAPRRTNR